MTETAERLRASGRPLLNRRELLKGATAGTILIMGGALVAPVEAWALEVQHLKPETMRTLIKMARDIFPHDRLADRFYAAACKGYDSAAAKDMIESGVAAMDAIAQSKYGRPYADVGWEIERVDVLRQMSGSPLFMKVRGDLVVTLYNQKEVWPLFGYEGSSADKGGYIERGFNDIDWL